jgi:AraC family transcriptional regulator, transcriptional activator of pobA
MLSFTKSFAMENPIPTQELLHKSQPVFFAFRTMEENHERTGGKPDIPHRHDFYTILLVKNACGKHFVDYQEYPLKPEIVFLLSPGQVHQIVSNCPPTGDIIMFNNEFLNLNYVSAEFISNIGLFSSGTSVPPIEINEEGMRTLAFYSGEIRKAFESEMQFKYDVIASNLKLFLIECNRYAIPSKVDNPQAIEAGRVIVRTFKGLLEANFAQWHRVNTYARQLNITPDYLNNVIKGSIGKTAKELIAQRITLEAKRLGLHTSLTLKEIAYSLGFDDPSHFSKFFKNEAGQSFSEFREQLEKKLKG